MTANGSKFHLAWFQSHITAVALGTEALKYVLVPAESTEAISILLVEVISETGKPLGRIGVNPLQLASPRDPDLTHSGPEVKCPNERAILKQLLSRASAAGYLPLLPEIVQTTKAPRWARHHPLDLVASRRRPLN